MSDTRTQMDPERAIERYLTDKKPEWAESTYYNNASSLGLFLSLCQETDLHNICDIDGFHISDFKKHRREEGGVNEMTLYNDLCSLRSFLRWSNSMGLIESWVVENMILNDPDEKVRSEKIEPETANRILEYLDDFEYATARHALFALLWDSGIRLGNARSLDVGDYCSEEKYIEVTHDPDEGTPQKNKEPAEREINLYEWVCEIFDDYGRNPIFSTNHGRMALSNLRTHIRRLTRPCHYTGECPHDREQSECVAVQEYNKAAQCPGSHKPHAMRRGAITHWLNEGHRKELISDRMNVSIPTLDKHYDARTESEKRDLRREMFDME